MSRSPLSLSSLRRLFGAAVGTAVLLGAVACGAASPPADPAAAPVTPPVSGQGADGRGSEGHGSGGHGGHGGHGGAGVPAPTLYAVQTGPLGVVVTDGSGRLIYRSAADSAAPPASHCEGPCAETWIPVTADPGQELDLAGVAENLVGHVQRADGSTQLTLAGWPLYRHRDDDGSLASTGRHGEDGTWFVVTPTGEQATPQ